MKERLIIIKNEEIIFENKVLELPIKDDFLIAKSIEIFDDDDPCIIHQSFIVNEFVSLFLDLFDNNCEIKGSDFVANLNFLDIENIELLTFRITR
ncbi:MAG: hypothetical protein QM489_03030 [Candidatus Izemoplasma sp.]